MADDHEIIPKDKKHKNEGFRKRINSGGTSNKAQESPASKMEEKGELSLMELERVGRNPVNMCLISPETLTKSWLAAMKSSKQESEERTRFRVDLRRLKGSSNNGVSCDSATKGIQINLKKRNKTIWEENQETKASLRKESIRAIEDPGSHNWSVSRPSGEELRAEIKEKQGTFGNHKETRMAEVIMKKNEGNVSSFFKKDFKEGEYPLPFVYSSLKESKGKEDKQRGENKLGEIQEAPIHQEDVDYFEDPPLVEKKRKEFFGKSLSSERNLGKSLEGKGKATKKEKNSVEKEETQSKPFESFQMKSQNQNERASPSSPDLAPHFGLADNSKNPLNKEKSEKVSIGKSKESIGVSGIGVSGIGTHIRSAPPLREEHKGKPKSQMSQKRVFLVETEKKQEREKEPIILLEPEPKRTEKSSNETQEVFEVSFLKENQKEEQKPEKSKGLFGAGLTNAGLNFEPVEGFMSLKEQPDTFSGGFFSKGPVLGLIGSEISKIAEQESEKDEKMTEKKNKENIQQKESPFGASVILNYRSTSPDQTEETNTLKSKQQGQDTVLENWTKTSSIQWSTIAKRENKEENSKGNGSVIGLGAGSSGLLGGLPQNNSVFSGGIFSGTAEKTGGASLLGSNFTFAKESGASIFSKAANWFESKGTMS